MTAWDASVDFLVVGSGAAGMTGALLAHDLGARALILEKSACYGGSTAISGGTIWVPANHLMAEAEIPDSVEAGLEYLESITRGGASRDRLRTYVENAPTMVRYLARRSHVRFQCMPRYPDYYPEAPGGRAGGRTIEPQPFEALVLGPERKRQRPFDPGIRVLRAVSITASEARTTLDGGLPALRLMTRLALGYYLNLRARIRTRENTRYTLGSALAGRLRRSLLDREVPLWLETPVRELVVEDGRVAGVVAEQQGRELRIEGSRGVLLAAGGFESSTPLRRRYQQEPISGKWTAGSPENVGDLIEVGCRAGAALDLMDEAWWSPVVIPPPPGRPRVMIMEKGLPGSIIVNRRGERFMNEAAPYNDIGHSMYAAHSLEAPAIPAYFIFDRSYRKKHAIGPIYPAAMRPDWAIPRGLRSDFITIARTIPELAGKLGIDCEGLERTVERFNEMARNGKDTDHGRGESLQDRYYSDAGVEPNPCLGPIAAPPFYAVSVYPGDLGTKGGFRTDASARVLTELDEPVPGLYAAGNCAASVMGRTYPGAGGTIGPAMAFAYLAARHALGGSLPEDATA